MISLSALRARIKHKKIADFAGDCFLAEDAIPTQIPYLRDFASEQFLFGIYASPTKWTVLSVKHLFACNEGLPFYIPLNPRAHEIHAYVGRAGTKHVSDVVLADGKSIWMKSVALSCLFQNMLLPLQNLPGDIVLAE